MAFDFSTLILALGKSFLFVFAAILPILNPAATAPIFLGLTEGASRQTRIVLARKIARNMFFLMIGSMMIGSYVLDIFGISLAIVRVGGGLIVAATAWRMLTVTPSNIDSRTELADAFTPEHARHQAFYPLTFPISCGPGSVAAAITVGVTMHSEKLTLSLANMTGAILALLTIAILMYIAFRYAQQLLKPLGEAGAIVFLRLSAFILLCLGVQIVWEGASELLRSVLYPAGAWPIA